MVANTITGMVPVSFATDSGFSAREVLSGAVVTPAPTAGGAIPAVSVTFTNINSVALSGATSGTFTLSASAAAGTGYGFGYAGGSATQSYSGLLATSGDTNTSIVLVPKGTGAIIAGPAPDGTATGGNARGQYAVDLQIVRSSASQVASGNYSFILGGSNNTATGVNSYVFGSSCNATGSFSVVFGGNSSATGDKSYAFGWYAATKSRLASLALSSGTFSTVGGAQSVWNTLGAATSSLSAATFTADGLSPSSVNICNLANNSAIKFRIDIIGRDTSGASGFAAWTLTGVMTRGATAATTAIAGTVVSSVDVLTGTLALQTAPTVTADTTNGGFNVSITPVTTNSIHWVAKIAAVEVL